MEVRKGILRTPDERFADLPDFPFEPHYAEVSSALGPLRMHYLDEGPRDAPVVLMLHGEPTWSFLYRKLIGPITAAGYRAVAPDMIGFGRSDKPMRREDYGFDRFTGWIRELVQALDLDRIILVCQDWGGPIGLRVLSEMPERFAGVVTANTLLQNCEAPPRGVSPWPGETIANWMETCRTATDLPIGPVIAATFVTEPGPGVIAAYEAPFPDARYKAGPSQITCGIPVAEGDEGLEANRRAWTVLEGFEKPFLTAYSDSDPSTIAWETVFQTRVPGAKGQPHSRIAGAGHFLQEEQGEALAGVVLDFLERNRLRN
ncbi:haloalkane dehalogenase [Flavisphingomonas formosensis]|uniref:haloalkane dehalogenase n=1 Tax=Flavisphingomonas formosensis TaxID=861534 RepID=UPI0012F74A93|nr:haloalkane dehalogenase [Sphingomonas formosensis]